MISEVNDQTVLQLTLHGVIALVTLSQKIIRCFFSVLTYIAT